MKVLLIEDDVRFVQVLASLLRDWGYEVDEALNPSDAQRMLEYGSYSIIITDENFGAPYRGGSDFILGNIHLMRNAKIILLTGMAYLDNEYYPILRNHDVSILEKNDSMMVEELRRILNS